MCTSSTVVGSALHASFVSLRKVASDQLGVHGSPQHITACGAAVASLLFPCPVLPTGLISSTSLTRITLERMTLPLGSGAHMFGRPGLRLPHLQELYLRGVERGDAYGDYLAGPPWLTRENVASLASCCEGGCLHTLTLHGVVQPGVEYGSLSTLTSLTYLSLRGSPTKGVDQLVSLVDLQLQDSSLTADTLVSIAKQLTRLTELSAFGIRLSPTWAGEVLWDEIDKFKGAGKLWICEGCESESPVCEQLADDLRQAGLLPPVDG